jgi:hypothetical protein
MPFRRDRLSERLFEPVAIPALIVGGALIAFVGGYNTTRANLQCQQIAADRHFEEAYLVPSRRGPDECVCRGKRDDSGNLDATVSESVPLL